MYGRIDWNKCRVSNIENDAQGNDNLKPLSQKFRDELVDETKLSKCKKSLNVPFFITRAS